MGCIIAACQRGDTSQNAPRTFLRAPKSKFAFLRGKSRPAAVRNYLTLIAGSLPVVVAVSGLVDCIGEYLEVVPRRPGSKARAKTPYAKPAKSFAASIGENRLESLIASAAILACASRRSLVVITIHQTTATRPCNWLGQARQLGSPAVA